QGTCREAAATYHCGDAAGWHPPREARPGSRWVDARAHRGDHNSRGQDEDLQIRRDALFGQELRDRLECVGFGDVKLYRNLQGEEYGFAAERLIAVARKLQDDPDL